MPRTPPAFAGTIPENYERYMGPWIFEPYAVDMAGRLPAGAQAVLEIACGTGRVSAHLRKALPAGARLVATDLNADMISIAKQIVPDKGIDWQTADAQALPFEDNSFDAVVCQFGLMFVPDKPKALREMRRVLKSGGRLLLGTWGKLEDNPAFYIADQVVSRYFPNDPPRFFHMPFSLHDDAELASLIKEAGFNSCTIHLVKKDCRSDSAADSTRGMLEGSPVYTAIIERGAELLPAIKKDVEAELARRFGTAPMASPMQAWVAEAV